MIAIVCADSNWGIGKDGGLLVRIPEDMRRFRRLTVGKAIILGRKTLGTFPGGKPLPDRMNIVLSRNSALNVEGAVVVGSACDALETASRWPSDEVFVAGGQEVYEAMLPYCNAAFVTRLAEARDADRRFPKLDAMNGWRLAEVSDTCIYGNIEYKYEKYCRA